MMAAVQSYGWHGFRDGTMVQKEHHVQVASCFLMVVGAKRMSGAKSKRRSRAWK